MYILQSLRKLCFFGGNFFAHHLSVRWLKIESDDYKALILKPT